MGSWQVPYRFGPNSLTMAAFGPLASATKPRMESGSASRAVADTVPTVIFPAGTTVQSSSTSPETVFTSQVSHAPSICTLPETLSASAFTASQEM